MRVPGKVIAITGGTGGLCSAMARRLAQEGARVYLLDLKGEEVAKELALPFIRIDLTSEEDWKSAITQILGREGRLDVLVNNAGINIRKPVEEMTIGEWNTMMSVNTGSVFLGCKYAIPVMKRQGSGVIINTSSVCGLVGHKYTPEAYTASKGAVTLLTKAIASRYGRFNIRCNSIHPSTVDTPLVAQLFKDPQRKAERYGEVPLGRLCDPSDVANAVLFLASDEAAFINGLSLAVDGGVTCY